MHRHIPKYPDIQVGCLHLFAIHYPRIMRKGLLEQPTKENLNRILVPPTFRIDRFLFIK